MSNKVYGFCDAGCRYRVPTYEEFMIEADTQLRVTPEKYGAVGDGVTDDTAAIQNAIDSGYPVVCSPKTYAISGIMLTKDTVIEGNGATWLGTGVQVGTHGLIIISTEEDENSRISLTLRDLKVTQASHVALLLNLYYLKELTIDNCTFDGEGWNDGVEQRDENENALGASSNSTLYYSENITIKNSVFTKSHGYGLFCVGNKGGIICDNEFSWCSRGGLYIKEYNENISVQRNRLLNTVKNFVVGDGALDLYGPSNDHIEITDNYICGFGSAENSGACACRIKGSRNVRFCGNKLVTDSNTMCGSMLALESRDGVRDDSVIIDGNYFISKEAIAVSRGIRILDDAISRNIVISNNIFDIDTANIDIQIRQTVENLTIVGNVFKYLEFYQDLPADGKYSNVIIKNNRCERIDVRHTDTLTIEGNNFNNPTTSIPIICSNSDRVIIGGNIVNTLNTSSWYSADNCTQMLIAQDNIFETINGKGTSMVNDFAVEKRGTEVSVDTTCEEAISMCVYGKTVYDSSVIPNLDNRDEYVSTNANQSMKLLITQDGTEVRSFSDSFVKHALHARSEAYANYKDASGQLWYSNYRDWRRGVDVHLVEEKVFDGTEEWTIYLSATSSAVIYRIGDESKYALGSDSPRRNQLESVVSNFARDYYYDYSGYGRIHINNSQGTGISYRTNQYTVEQWKTYLAEQYNAGTPLKVLYALATPYETPIPEDEKGTNAEIFTPSTSPVYSVNDESASINSLVVYKNDHRVKAILQLIERSV